MEQTEASKTAPLQFLRELHFIEASSATCAKSRGRGCSSFGNCTSLRRLNGQAVGMGLGLQFLRELHFIEAATCSSPGSSPPSLQFLRELHFIEARLQTCWRWRIRHKLQFLRELHFIEAGDSASPMPRSSLSLQFLRELHFIEAGRACR